jgi:HSP20 family protein
MDMAETASKVPVRTPEKEKEGTLVPKAREWHPFESLHKEIDRIFDDFDRSFGRFPTTRSLFDIAPMWRREIGGGALPAVDVVEHDKDYEITAELPGMDESNIEVKLSSGTLMIRGEKKDEREEKKKNHYVSERSYGLFERSFRVPEGVDTDRIEASFKKGVLTVTMPKTPESMKKDKKIAIKVS